MDVWLALRLFAISLDANGIFLVSILAILGGRIDTRTVIGASLVPVITCSCKGAAPFLRGRLTNILLAIILETATILGALSGVLLTGIIPTRFLFVLFASD